MPEHATVPYHSNLAIFELPPQLRDTTTHMFALTKNGPSEFSVVISHADILPSETLAAFGQRLLQELGEKLPRFALARSEERTLDGAPALAFQYCWRIEDSDLHQRQVVVLVPGSRPGTRQAMMIAATCTQGFTPAWHGMFDSILDSLKLRARAEPETVAAVESADALPEAVFALSERRRTLRLFSDQSEACRRTDALEVEEAAWSFFDAAGAALEARFVTPNSGTLWFKAGTYVLDARPHGTPLRECLHQAAMFVPDLDALPLADIAEVREYLERMDSPLPLRSRKVR